MAPQSSGRGVAAGRPLRRIRTEEDGDDVLGRESPGLVTHEWQEVRLDDVSLDDWTFQLRLIRGFADVRRSLERKRQREPVDLTGVALRAQSPG